MDGGQEATIASLVEEISSLKQRIQALENDYYLRRRTSLRYRFQPKVFDFHQYQPRKLDTPPNYSVPTPNTGALRIAIVTPSYRHAHFLPATIDSVLSQNYANLGYIVQDGGSQDGTREILESYGQRIAWNSAADGGQTDAINKGFAVVSGDIMAYLNSDDVLLPGTLHYVAHAFEKYPEVDFVYGNRIVIDEAGRETARVVLPPHDREVIKWADYIPQETMFWRRSVWERLGAFDTTFQFAMDWDFILRAQAAGFRFKRLPRFLGCFRVYPSQKTFAMHDIGQEEQDRLRLRSLGSLFRGRDINAAIAGYMKKQILYHRLYKLGIMRI
ncbi:MAG: glycosyltransferase family 2 protein [Mesorhizobium sp.]